MRSRSLEPSPRFLRVAQIVRITGMSKAKIHSDIRLGRLRALRLDRTVLIPLEELEAYLRRATPYSEPSVGTTDNCPSKPGAGAPIVGSRCRR